MLTALAAVAGVAGACAPRSADEVSTATTTTGVPRTPPTLLNAAPRSEGTGPSLPSSTTVTTATTEPGTIAPATSGPPGPTVTAAPAGCPATSNFIDVGTGRRALVRAPATSRPAPAVVVLHGYTGDPDHIERTSGWTPFGAAKGAVIVYPEGTKVSGQPGFGWATGTARFSTSGVDDVAYLDGLIDILVSQHCVDPTRVVLTGESNGAAMAVKAACDSRLTDAFRLVAPVIPAIDDGALSGCRGGKPFNLLAIAGKKDGVVPYNGRATGGQKPLAAQETWFTTFASQRNGCSSAPPERQRIDDAERITPTGCAAPTNLLAVDDGQHTWPGGPTGTGDLAPGRFPATSTIWSVAGL